MANRGAEAVGQLQSVEVKVDGQKEMIKSGHLGVFPLSFGPLKDVTINSTLVLFNASGEITDFQTLRSETSVIIALSVVNKQKSNFDDLRQTNMQLLKFDLETAQITTFGSFAVETEISAFWFQEEAAKTQGSASFRFLWLDTRKKIQFLRVTLAPESKTGSQGKTSPNVIFTLESDKYCEFTCFDVLCLDSTGDEFALAIGTKHGSIRHYRITKSHQPVLLESLNEFGNFHVVQICLFKCLDSTPSKTAYLISAITADGDLKIFLPNSPLSAIQIPFQNRPLSCLSVDPSLSLIYVLDETDRSLLTVINFIRQTDQGKNADSLKRNIKLEQPLSHLSFDFQTDTVAAVCNGSSIKTIPLRVCLLEPQGDHLQVQIPEPSSERHNRRDRRQRLSGSAQQRPSQPVFQRSQAAPRKDTSRPAARGPKPLRPENRHFDHQMHRNEPRNRERSLRPLGPFLPAHKPLWHKA